MLLHIHPFRQEPVPPRATPWHSLTPQTRLACIVLSVFAVALTANGKWAAWGVYGLGALCLIFVSRVRLNILLSRVAVEFAFVGVVLLGTLFRPEGQVVWSWGIFQVTDAGLVVLGSVTIKVLLSLLLLNLLILTTPVPALFQALRALRMPPLLVAIMASMYRYLQVLLQEFTTMRRAALSRNLMLTNKGTRRAIGHIIGALFVRTYERGERIYQAMLARGYRGLSGRGKFPPYQKRDFIAFALTGLTIVLGQIV
jgi:cobalt/nickel transport system permease protein